MPTFLNPTTLAQHLNVSAIPAPTITRIGADYGWTGAVHRVEFDNRIIIVKIPGPNHPFERSLREVHFYRHLGRDCPLELPQLLAHIVDGERVELLFTEVRGDNGDCVTGCTHAQADMLVDAIADLHRTLHQDARLESYDWLPRWGIGQADAERPHARRVERFLKQRPKFNTTFGDLIAPSLQGVIDRLDADSLDRSFKTVAALPWTLIHADLHLDNIMWREGDGAPVIIDWQSVSRGPGLYDLVRLLWESLIDGASPDVVRGLLDRYFDRRATGRDDDDSIRAMIRVVIAGVVSGFGGWDRAAMSARQIDVLRVGLSEARLGAMVSMLNVG